MIFPESLTPLAPHTLLAGRYRIERLLHTDVLARRYLATDEQAGLSLAVHELLGSQWPTAEDREQAGAWFEGAAARLQGLEHPAIPIVRGHWVTPEEGGPFYLATDYVPGLTLAEELQEADGRIRWQRALDWAIGICESLVYLHGKGYVHGELRPQNLVLDARSDLPALVDFGLARRLAATAGDNWGYVPFEQHIGRAEPHSDLYALGVLLHVLVGGRDPDIAYGHLRRSGLDVQRALRALFPPEVYADLGIPQPLTKLIARATAFGAQDRFPDAAAMATALRAVRGPEVELTEAADREPETEPVWTRLGLTRAAWFALPASARNKHLLELAARDASPGNDAPHSGVRVPPSRDGT